MLIDCSFNYLFYTVINFNLLDVNKIIIENFYLRGSLPYQKVGWTLFEFSKLFYTNELFEINLKNIIFEDFYFKSTNVFTFDTPSAIIQVQNLSFLNCDF